MWVEPYIRANVVEVELGASRAADVDSSSQLNHSGLFGFAILQVLEFVLELADVIVDMVLEYRSGYCFCLSRSFPCKIRFSSVDSYLVRIGLALSVKLIDGSRSDFKVLNDGMHGLAG